MPVRYVVSRGVIGLVVRVPRLPASLFGKGCASWLLMLGRWMPVVSTGGWA